MLEIKLILCPIDFSEFSIRAYSYALSMAEHYRAKVVAQHIVELAHHPYAQFAGSVGDFDSFSRAMLEGGKDQLREIVKKHAHSEIQQELEVRQGLAPDCILSLAHERKADLIVMGTHGRRGFDRLMLGTTTDRVMRRASCPVMAVSQPPRESMPDNSASQPASAEQHHDHRLSRILFSTDFSENSERALRYAISATLEYDAELTLLHVVESATPAKDVIMTTASQLDKLIPAEERKTLRFKIAVRAGKPYQQIIEFAEEAQIDLVVMAVRGRGALDLAVFGSTTYRVMQLGPCPVLAVHV
jgi:nucleotide-binding universal stress UspA family protein